MHPLRTTDGPLSLTATSLAREYAYLQETSHYQLLVHHLYYVLLPDPCTPESEWPHAARACWSRMEAIVIAAAAEKEIRAIEHARKQAGMERWRAKNFETLCIERSELDRKYTWEEEDYEYTWREEEAGA